MYYKMPVATPLASSLSTHPLFNKSRSNDIQDQETIVINRLGNNDTFLFMLRLRSIPYYPDGESPENDEMWSSIGRELKLKVAKRKEILVHVHKKRYESLLSLDNNKNKAYNDFSYICMGYVETCLRCMASIGQLPVALLTNVEIKVVDGETGMEYNFHLTRGDDNYTLKNVELYSHVSLDVNIDVTELDLTYMSAGVKLIFQERGQYGERITANWESIDIPEIFTMKVGTEETKHNAVSALPRMQCRFKHSDKTLEWMKTIAFNAGYTDAERSAFDNINKFVNDALILKGITGKIWSDQVYLEYDKLNSLQKEEVSKSVQRAYVTLINTQVEPNEDAIKKQFVGNLEGFMYRIARASHTPKDDNGEKRGYIFRGSRTWRKRRKSTGKRMSSGKRNRSRRRKSSLRRR